MPTRARPNLPPPNLVVPQEEARGCLSAQIARGEALLDESILSFSDLMKARVARREWSLKNHSLLLHLSSL